jgi:hypothetical protein
MGTFNSIATKVDLAMAHSDKPCLGDGCDGDTNCKRHEKTGALVLRLYRMRQK